MITKSEVEKLADLARIALKPEEISALEKDLESILNYVSELQTVDVGDISREALDYNHRNVMRVDETKHEPNQWSETLLAQAPDRHEQFWSVKKILDQNFDA